MNGKTMKCNSLFATSLLALALANGAIAASHSSRTEDLWQADLSVLVEQIPQRHVDAFKWTSRESFFDEANTLREELGALDPRHRPIRLAALVASLKDGHSFMGGYFPVLGFVPETFPIRLYAFSDGIFIHAAAHSHADYIGGRVIAINGTPIDEALDKVSRLFPVENAMAAKSWGVYGLTAPDVLGAFGLTDQKRRAVFELEHDGRRIQLDLAGTQRAQPTERWGQVNDPDWVRADTGAGTLLRESNPDKAYWSVFDASSGTYFVQLNQIRNEGELGLIEFFREVARNVAERPVKRFVLDLRWNPGGETGMNDEIIKILLASPVINRPDRFFVLIGRRTFSSAQLLCTALDRYSHAVFIGEPSGIRTHFFANTRKSVVLPHSGLGIFLSTNWWQPTNSDELQPWQRPDVAVDESFDDFRHARDPALTQALQYQPEVDLAAVFATAMRSDATDWESVIDQYRKVKNDERNRYLDTEALANDFGYALLESGEQELALRILEFNTMDYPESANAFDSLAEAQEAAGRLTESFGSYMRAAALASTSGADPGPHLRSADRLKTKLEATQGQNHATE